MKQVFKILKSRPKVDIKLTRDPVSMADDSLSNDEILNTYSFLETHVLVNQISRDYLPKVRGFDHTWDCVFNGVKIATITYNDVLPEIEKVDFKEENVMHFVYHSAKF